MEERCLLAYSSRLAHQTFLEDPGPPVQGGTTHSELVPPALITIQENAAHTLTGQSDISHCQAR